MSSLLQEMAWRQTGAKPFLGPMLIDCGYSKMHKIWQCGSTLQIIVNMEYMYRLASAVSKEASCLEAQVCQSS